MFVARNFTINSDPDKIALVHAGRLTFAGLFRNAAHGGLGAGHRARQGNDALIFDRVFILTDFMFPRQERLSSL